MASFALARTSLSGSLTSGTRYGIANLADCPIFPRAIAADDRTLLSGSLRSGMRSGITDFADSPISPRANAAPDRTTLYWMPDRLRIKWFCQALSR